MGEQPQNRDPQEQSADTFWQWFAIGVLVFCWLAATRSYRVRFSGTTWIRGGSAARATASNFGVSAASDARCSSFQ